MPNISEIGIVSQAHYVLKKIGDINTTKSRNSE
jgi:hypothetical protein